MFYSLFFGKITGLQQTGSLSGGLNGFHNHSVMLMLTLPKLSVQALHKNQKNFQSFLDENHIKLGHVIKLSESDRNISSGVATVINNR